MYPVPQEVPAVAALPPGTKRGYLWRLSGRRMLYKTDWKRKYFVLHQVRAPATSSTTPPQHHLPSRLLHHPSPAPPPPPPLRSTTSPATSSTTPPQHHLPSNLLHHPPQDRLYYYETERGKAGERGSGLIELRYTIPY